MLRISILFTIVNCNYDNYKENLRHNLAKYWRSVKDNIDSPKQKNKEYSDTSANPLLLKVGDRVLMKKPLKHHNFSTPYDGPFIVEESISPVTIRIKKGNKSTKIHANKLKLA